MFSDEQLAAVNAGEGPWAVFAAPGSGKTSCVVGRAKRLLESNPADEVLALTFTKSAAKEMGQRAGFENDVNLRPHGFRTFHSLALAFCTRERLNFPKPLSTFPLNLEDGLFALDALKNNRIKNFREFRSYLSQMIRQRISPQKCIERARTQAEINLAQGYRDYMSASLNAGKLDFDSLVVAMVDLLETREYILDRWSYRWILTDESQDGDGLNWRVVQLLSRQRRNVWSCGDPGQCVYAFRGAVPELFMNMGQMFSGTRELLLSTNYRSTPEVVAFCKSISPIQTELVKKTRAFNPSGPAVVMKPFLCREDEADAVLADLKTVYFTDFFCTIADPKFSGAVLTRTNRELQIYQELLYRSGMRFHLLKGSGYWTQPEIKKVLDELPRYASMPPTLAVESVISSLRLMDKAKKYSEVDNDPVENLNELTRIAARYDTVQALLEYAARATAASRGKKGVALGTAHGAKGLEWNSIYVTNVAEGSFPHKNADNTQEEARLLYVACSRAAECLWVSWSGIPSRFLAEVAKPAGAELLLGEKI